MADRGLRLGSGLLSSLYPLLEKLDAPVRWVMTPLSRHNVAIDFSSLAIVLKELGATYARGVGGPGSLKPSH